MKLRRNEVKSFLMLLILINFSACAKHESASSTCKKTAAMASTSMLQNKSTLIDLKALAQNERSNNLSLIIKVTSVADELDKIRRDLVAAHMPYAHSMGKIKISAVNSEMIELTIPKQSPAIQVIEDKISSNEILYAEPNYETFLVEPSATAIFNDPSLSQQWAQSKIQSYNAWTKTKGDSSIIVAVVDTGVDYTHNDLKNSMWVNPHEIVNGIDDDHNGYVDDIYGYDFNNNDSKPMSDDSSTYHGTHVAGTIAATLNNNVGGAGVAPGVKIMALKYLNNFGSGTTSNAIRAIDYAIQNGAKIINNSWGSMNRSQALQDEIEVARLHNILFVAAAGNGDIKGNGINIDRIPFYPAGFSNDNIVSVAASDINDNLAAWSNYGLNSVDVAAPGVNIWSTRNGNTYASLSGTSMATPAVSGVLSLIWSENHNLKYAEVRKILFASVDKIDVMKNKVSAGGRVNAFRAVTMAANTVIPKPTPPPVTPPPVTPPPATQCLP